MVEQEGRNQRLIVTHAVLTGLTPLIPIPVLDDLVKTYFQRRMVRQLAALHGYAMGPGDIEILADERGSGCLMGCLGTTLALPLKLIFRKVFFFLEWKRAVDTVSRNFYHGYLIDCALDRRWCGPLGPKAVPEVRAAIDAVLNRFDTRLLEHAVHATFRQSKAVLKSAARLLERSLRAVVGTNRQQVERAIELVEPVEEREIAGVVGQLESAIGGLPQDHFERLKADLRAALGLN
jgi:hypothetical protein